MVWNNLLDWRNKEYSLNGNKINYTKSSAHLTELKNQEQFSWLNDVSSVTLQQTLRSQDVAFSNSLLNVLILNENLAINHLD